MLRNYLKVAWRNLRRNKGYVFINVAGLSVGIAACLLIYLIVSFETSFDNFHPEKEKIYRVSGNFKNQDGTTYTMGSAWPLARTLRIDFPQLKKVAAIYSIFGIPVTVVDSTTTDNKRFLEDGVFFAEPQFFEIFDFPLLSGDHKTALNEPGTVLMSRQMAEKYFGDWTKAMGKTIRVGTRTFCKVTGVLQDTPPNTDFPLQIVVSFLSNRNAASTDWVTSNSDLNTFIALPESETEAGFNQSLEAFVKKHKPAEYVKDGYQLQPLKTIHADGRFGNYRKHTFSNSLVTALTLIGLFLLVIACVNFINLATAQAITRAKEVGVRKVLGSGRKQLVFQFLIETLLIGLVAIIVAIGIAALCLPFLNQLLRVSLNISFSSDIILLLLSILIGVTLLSGFYPAIILSGYSPIMALKSRIVSSSGSLSLRKALVVVQFIIAQALIIATLVVLGQMNFFKNAPMGFDRENILTIPVPSDSLSKTRIASFKNELLQQPGITKVSYSNYVPSEDSHWETDFKFDNSETKTNFSADLKFADADYFPMYQVEFVAGRPYTASDTVRELVVNEALLKKFGITDPEKGLGKMIRFLDPEKNAPIVGVVKDFHSYSFEKSIAPVIAGSWKNQYLLANIKLQSNAPAQTLSDVERLWKATFPAAIYKFEFLDDKINGYYKQESRLSTLYTIFSGIAILISCLGLYGLISFMAERRKKEIGIRKVLGASVNNIVMLFSREFSILMGVAFLISAPLAWYFMNKWLENYAYRINLGARIFLITICISVIIVLISIGYRAIRAALTNPVKNLRTE